MQRIVIVGGGQAGASLAARLHARGFRGALTLVCAEPRPPYQRPPLSKAYLKGEIGEERLWLRPPAFWAEAGIRLVIGRAAVAIDRAARRVVLAGGEVLDWDALALCTGARPRLLPGAAGGGLRGLHPVRTVADVDGLAPELRPGIRTLVIGGGYIGLEAAAVLAAKGLAVTLVEAAPRILARVAAPETADFFRALHARHGVVIHEGAALDRLEGEAGRVARAVLADGSVIACDLAILGIGILPETALAEAAGLALDNGIAVDAHGRTSDPRIFAAGDCASFPWAGRRIRLESVQNAIDQAEAAADAMLGAPHVYAPVPWFWSDQYDVKLQIAGLGTGADRVVVRPGSRAGTQSVWYFAGSRFLAVDAMNEPRAYMTGKRWLEAGHSPDPDAIGDPGRDLRSLG